MAKAAIATKIHKPLDTHGDIPTKVTLNLEALVDIFPDFSYFTFSEIISAGIRIYTGLG